MAETFPERVARIAHDHNISDREARRVARAEVIVEEKQKIRAIQKGIESGRLIRVGPNAVIYNEEKN